MDESDSDDEDSSCLPLGSLQEVLQTGQAHQRILEKQIGELQSSVKEVVRSVGTNEADTYGTVTKTLWLNLATHLNEVVESSQKVVNSLSHCMALFMQQEEVRLLQLKQEQEKCRVLEDALHVLAREHHDLERSVVSPYRPRHSSPSFAETECDEYFDADEPDDNDGTEDSLTPVLAQSDSDEATLSQDATAMDSDVFLSFSQSATPNVSPPPEEFKSQWGRSRLPKPMFSRNEFSVWSILKQCIGKELSKITMPVVFNEPLSLLQRMSENMEYAFLLQRANESDDAVERIEYVAAFAVSALSSNWERLNKPFNPLLGETYELVREDIGFRMIAEQVVHHPPVSAFHSDSPHFVCHGSVQPKMKFWGKSVEIKPEGTITVELLRHKEIYTWSGVSCCVHNIIVGKLWFEQCGLMEIACQNSGLSVSLNFKPAGWFGRDLHRTEGFVLDRQKTKLRFLYGKWTHYLKSAEVEEYEEYMRTHSNKFRPPDHPASAHGGSPSPGGSPAHTPKKMVARFNTLTRTLTGGGSSTASEGPVPSNGFEGASDFDNGEVPKSDSTYSLDIPNSNLLWHADPRPDYSPEYYHFTLFAMALNEQEAGANSSLAPTDSRLRPDIRRLEEGDVDGAAFEKNRLEEKQREARKYRKKHKESWEPRWFKQNPNPNTKKEDWLYKGGYWERNFSRCPDIF